MWMEALQGNFMKYTKIQSLLMSHRILAVFLLSFSSGLPLALTGSTLQAWYTVAGVNLMTIGILTTVGQPYVYKFLWAPLVDRFNLFKIGRRRDWILLMQFLLALSLAWMALLNPEKTPWLLASIALIVAFFSATQDIAIDAYRADVLAIRERGFGASVTNVGGRLALLVSSSLALIFAAQFGWRSTYFVMAGLMLCCMIVTWRSPQLPPVKATPVRFGESIIAPLRQFMGRRNATVLLIFILLYKMCDAFALSLNTVFLIRGVGFSLVDIGAITKIMGITGALLGSLVGGLLLSRMGLYRSLMIFGFLQMVSNLSFALLFIVGKSYLLMASSIFLDYFFGGMSSVAFVVLLISLCDHRYSATQYALFSAVASLTRVFIGPIAAMVVEHVGWVQFYIWSFIIGIPSLFILYWLRHRFDFISDRLSEA